MRILLVGGGGREHALAWKIAQSPLVTELFIAPGNGGTALFGKNVDIKDSDLPGLLKFALENKIDLVIASSMGGFTALQVKGVRKILINPCMVPSDIFRMEILPDISNAEIEKYLEMENQTISLEEINMTYSLFATHDELFSYKQRFDQLYDASKSFSMPGKHVISPKNIRENLLPLINQLFPL